MDRPEILLKDVEGQLAPWVAYLRGLGCTTAQVRACAGGRLRAGVCVRVWEGDTRGPSHPPVFGFGLLLGWFSQVSYRRYSSHPPLPAPHTTRRQVAEVVCLCPHLLGFKPEEVFGGVLAALSDVGISAADVRDMVSASLAFLITPSASAAVRAAVDCLQQQGFTKEQVGMRRGVCGGRATGRGAGGRGTGVSDGFVRGQQREVKCVCICIARACLTNPYRHHIRACPPAVTYTYEYHTSRFAPWP